MIRLLARPLPQWTPAEDWTQLTIEGDDEELIASIVVAHLLLTRHEVLPDEEGDSMLPGEEDES